MSKHHKSAVEIRVQEIGRCIRLLHNLRREMPLEDLKRHGMGRAITALGEYKRTVREGSGNKSEFVDKETGDESGNS